MARALEVVGERWTFLILRDAFYGVRRFGDFAVHLGIPRAVLSDRLTTLTAAGVLERPTDGHGGYVLTAKGLDLWPVIRNLIAWGDEHYSTTGPGRLFQHAADGGAIRGDGSCTACEVVIDVHDVEILPGPGLAAMTGPDRTPDEVTLALSAPHRLLAPLR
jgi:DNA-binding HxlR family transcriptional regulator